MTTMRCITAVLVVLMFLAPLSRAQEQPTAPAPAETAADAPSATPAEPAPASAQAAPAAAEAAPADPAPPSVDPPPALADPAAAADEPAVAPADPAAPVVSPEVLAKLPPPASVQVNFTRDIKPLFEASCVQCHAKGKAKGDFSLETRESFLKGGETGQAAIIGKSAESLIVHLVAAVDPDHVMPLKGTKWTPEQVGLLRAWIDQGAAWEGEVNFAKAPPRNLTPRPIALPEGPDPHPIDRLLAPYFASNNIVPPAVVDDATFARRAYLDTIGLLPTPSQLETFLADASPDRRPALVRQLLSDNANYADHWLTFWNDLLRNDYRGTGYIDGGRRQITGWLYTALLTNKPYDAFVRELVNPPTPASEGFTKGIIWRGTVNASMTPQMQAAQSISQVFLGVNIKCASCHDSFINDWTLSDAYSLAAVYSDAPLEMVHCDKPTGKLASPGFLYPQIGQLDPAAPKAQRLTRFAELMTSPQNGRLPRTIVNRLWAKLIGRGLVEPLDDMEQAAWNADLLDWLAEDLVANKYDLKHTLELILTSKAYQLPTVESPAEADKEAYVFRGPYTRRLTAEQLADAVSSFSGQWADFPHSNEFDFSGGGTVLSFTLPGWIWTDEPLENGLRRGSWQVAKAKMDEAQRLASEVQALVAQSAPNAGEVAARARAAADEAARVIAEAEAILQSPERSAQIVAAPEKLGPEVAAIVRHRVVFRKKFTLDAAPTDAFAALAASQRAEVTVNGKPAGVALSPANSNGRAYVFDLRPLLVQGENVITISVDSHTEKPGADGSVPQLAHHLNGRSGVAFYAKYRVNGQTVELTTDPTWRVRRAPDADPNAPALDDSAWLLARSITTAPVDEGPALEPTGKTAEGDPGLDLGQRLPAAVASAARAGTIRGALLSSDPLLAALDRPNREVVVPVRSISPTTIQALEMTNGATLDSKLRRAANTLHPEAAKDPTAWVNNLYRHALSRQPTDAEREIALELLGQPATPEGVADLLWSVTMLPEFQLLN